MTIKTKMRKKTNITLSIPIYNLIIEKEIGGEIRIGDVIFVASYKIPRIRKRLGINETITSINKKIKYTHRPLDPGLFKDAKTYAFLRCGYSSEDDAKDKLRIIKEAYWILASSQIMYSKRYDLIHFGFPEHATHLYKEYYLFSTNIKDSRHIYETTSPMQEFILDKQWKNIVGKFFFFHLLKIINGKTSILWRWRKILVRATVLSAKSHFETDIAAAFLYNWIAIELLLKDRQGKTENIIVNRITALFGFLKIADEEYWRKTIKNLYKKRNSFVHGGESAQITIEDLLISDKILSNLLINLIRLNKVFPSKSSVTDFCDEVNARKYLNLKINWPNLRYYSPSISMSEISKIKKKKGW